MFKQIGVLHCEPESSFSSSSSSLLRNSGLGRI